MTRSELAGWLKLSVVPGVGNDAARRLLAAFGLPEAIFGASGAAHEGALAGAAEGMLATIAVVGTGLERVYPKRHLQLARRIAQSGVIVGEYPLGTPPLPPNFPKRNRIISGLAHGTLVVE